MADSDLKKMKLNHWDKKKRTMIRFIKNGDVFCFKVSSNEYRFGYIISKIITGHSAIILDIISQSPYVTPEQLSKAQALINPIVLDTYSLFDRKTEGEWRIIGNNPDFSYPKDSFFFTFGVADSCKKVDVYDNIFAISPSEAKKYDQLYPHGHLHVINKISLNN